MTWLLLSEDLVDARKAPHDVSVSLWKRDRVRLSLEQDLNAVDDRAGLCKDRVLSLHAAGCGRVNSDWRESLGYRLMGCWSPFAAVLADWWIDVAGRSSFSIGSFGGLPWFDFSLESELVFLAERSLLRSRMGFPYR